MIFTNLLSFMLIKVRLIVPDSAFLIIVSRFNKWRGTIAYYWDRGCGRTRQQVI